MTAGPVPRLARPLPLVALMCMAWAPAASAFDLTLPPGASLIRSDPPEPGRHDIATDVWTGTTLPIETISGSLARTIWTLPAGEQATVASLADGIAARLRTGGATIVLSCADSVCGGFDFRSRLDLGQSPEMLVDIGNFHYIAARDGERTVAITVSRGGNTLYVHSAAIGGQGDTGLWVTPPGQPAGNDAIETAQDIATRIAQLPQTGAVTLEDLFFRTGASDLSGGDYLSLVALSEFLSENPGRRIVLVGHTDAVGNLETNIALSRARAEAVRLYLIERLDVDPGQVSATGIGYLAPRATNETEDGRETNRRVEAVLLYAE